MLMKHATFELLEAKVAQRGDGLMKSSHKATFDYDPRPGYLYVRSRAISSRTNDNYDNFPAEEIEAGYLSFIGKPVFVNHHNDDHRRARGVIIDAALHTDRLASGDKDTWVEVLMEVDAIRFPKLAEAIIKGEIERTSMGTDVAYSLCSVCSNKASTPMEYCKHIPKMKGMKVERVTASGDKESVLVYEKCYGLSFFENSLLVEEPADPTAYFLGVDDRGLSMAASKKALMTGDTFPCQVCGKPAFVGVDSIAPDGTKTEFGLCAEHEDSYELSDDYTTIMWAAASRPRSRNASMARMRSDLAKTASRKKAETYLTPEGDIDWNASPCSVCGRRAGEHIWRQNGNQLGRFQPQDHPANERAWCPVKVASRKQGIGETVAPSEVDTLREEFCPVCGEADSFDGDTCKVCQYVRPPEEFMDPDLEKAKQIDLRQEEEAEVIPEEAIDGEVPDGLQSEDGAQDTGEFAEVHPSNSLAVDDDDAESEDDEDSDAESDEPEKNGADDEDEEDEEDDEEGSDDDTPEFLKKKKKSRLENRDHTGGTLTMSSTLRVLANQERKIRELQSALAFVVKMAGLSNHPKVARLVRRAAEDENPAAGTGWASDGVPSPEAPAFSTDETLGDIDGDDVETIGGTSETDVAPDAQTDLGSSDTVLNEPLDLNEQDVTAPVAGTDDLGEGARGNAGSGRTETEVRIDQGAANNPQPAFDMADGGWTEAQKEGRFIAALRLARLQIQAGIKSGEDLALANTIAHNKRISNSQIQHDIETLSQVIQASKKGQRRATVPRNLVPQKVAAQRSMPSMQAPEYPIQSVASGPSDDEFLFE